MICKDFKGIQVSTLGMGNMRLPSTNSAVQNAPIDWPEAHKVIDYAYEHGVNYFDTAWVYNNGESERCLGECMKKHPRESFYLATKFHIDAQPDYKYVFEEQLKRLQTDYIDFYLIHCLLDGNYQKYLDSGAIDYFLEQKAKGRIKYLGFSSHASLETLRKFADHHAWDFGQLQINYYDWYYGSSQAEYKILEERNIPVIVMEPVRGGKLAALTENAGQILKSARPEWSHAKWALNFVRSLPAVLTTLSGMSNMDQVIENVASFSEADSFGAKEQEVLKQACDIFQNDIKIPCTACRYCCEDCPMQINIPEYLKVYNAYKVNGSGALSALKDIDSTGKPSDCIGCGACTGHCPQNIKIPELIKELAELK